MNQALFEKLYVVDGRVVDPGVAMPHSMTSTRVQGGDPMDIHPAQVAAKDFIQFDPDKAGQTWTLSDALFDVGSNKRVMVGAEGLEPPTRWL